MVGALSARGLGALVAASRASWLAAWLAASMGSYICGGVPWLHGGGGGAGENFGWRVVKPLITGVGQDKATDNDAGCGVADNVAKSEGFGKRDGCWRLRPVYT